MNSTESLRIVIFKEDGLYIAQCLDYDICAQAETITDLQSNMDHLIELELGEMKESNQELDPAPERFHNMWEENLRLSASSNEYRMIAA